MCDNCQCCGKQAYTLVPGTKNMLEPFIPGVTMQVEDFPITAVSELPTTPAMPGRSEG